MQTASYLVGFGEADITPRDPVRLHGYYYERVSTAVHDRLRARSMAVSDGRCRLVICIADLVRLTGEVVAETRKLIRESCGLGAENLLLAVIHTHTGPVVDAGTPYAATLPRLLAESVRLALQDLSSAELQMAHAEGPAVQFIRRYRMKDGSVRTNPGILNPDVVAPIGVVDPELSVLLATDAGRVRGGLVHFALHCDTIGGTEISADWTYYVRKRMQKEFGENLRLLTPIGPAGDVNHWNVFADVSLRGFAEAERIGCAIGDVAVKALRDGTQRVAAGKVIGLRKEIEVLLRMPSKAELAAARQVLSQPPPKGVDFTMERVEALRCVRVAEIGPAVRADIGLLAFGDVALVGIPAEFFTELGREIKRKSPFRHTLVVTLAHASLVYIGARRNYEEGGYEMTSSIVVPGTGEQMVDAVLELLNKARNMSD